MSGSYARELTVARAIAAEATSVARERSASVRREEKANTSFVTDLDKDLEILVRGRLAEAFPDDVLTGEEYEDSGGSGPRKWSIDPIDGTGNLVHGLPLWAVSIGLLDRGEPVVGVIAVPPLGETYWAVKGEGAWLDGERIEAAADAESFHPHENISVGTNALRSLDPRTIPGRIRDLGAACVELVFTSCGRLVACTHKGEMAHDLAAGAVIASEAGCSFATIDGRRLSPAEFVASAPVKVATFVSRPGRLGAIVRSVKPLTS